MQFYLHENAHVPKLLVAHAALEAQHLRVGVRLVDVDLDLLLLPAIDANVGFHATQPEIHVDLLPEQDVVDGTGDLAQVDEGVRLHVLPPLELHLAVVALDLLGAHPAPLHVVDQARPRLLVLLAFGALFPLSLHIAAAALFLLPPRPLGRLQAPFDLCLFGVDLFPVGFEVADRPSRIIAFGLVTW